MLVAMMSVLTYYRLAGDGPPSENDDAKRAAIGEDGVGEMWELDLPSFPRVTRALVYQSVDAQRSVVAGYVHPPMVAWPLPREMARR